MRWLDGITASMGMGEGRAWHWCPRLRCSGSRLLSMERALEVASGSSFRVLHKRADSAAPAFCAFPAEKQELDGRTLPGFGAPSPLRGPSLSFRPRRSGVCALCLAATLPADVDHPESQEVFG